MIKKLDHLVITTNDVEPIINFYKALGFEVFEVFGRYELHAENIKINVQTAGKELPPHARNVQPGSADFCFELDCDIKDFVNKARMEGVAPEKEFVTRIGRFGSMTSVYYRDPDGNIVEFCHY